MHEIYEVLLNGILHYFAIFSALNKKKRDVAHELVERYLKDNLGVTNRDVYIDLFDYFLDLYIDIDEFDLFRENARNLCENLEQNLSRFEQYFVLLRVIELVKILEADDDHSRILMQSTAQAFSIGDTDFEDIRRLVFEPDRFEKLSPNFLVVSSKWRGSLACKRLHDEALQGEFVILKIPEIDTYLLSALSEGMRIDDTPISPRSVQILAQGNLIRDDSGNVIYFNEIERHFYDFPDLKSGILFNGTDINFHFPGSENGLHDFSFAIQSGSLTGVMGGSGVGKSTLLAILNGTLRPDAGAISINGVDLYGERDELQGVIGHVPQDDLLFGDLTVYQNLYFSARLCLANLTDEQIRARVDQMLLELNQHEIKDLKTGSPLDKVISGGQRKRLNIALELIREPSILFADEPTSGLSSSDSENVMSLLKSQAAKGKVVIVNIHQPSSNIFKMFDQLWILDQGGYPIFSGNPVDAIRYFRESVNFAGAEQSVCPHCGNVNPEQIFNIIETKRLDETGQFTRERRYTPQFWHDRYLDRFCQNHRQVQEDTHAVLTRTLFKPTRWGQLKIFLERNILSRLSNRQYLAINLLEAPLLGLIVALLTRFSNYGEYRFGDNKYIAIFYFMSVIVALFMGLSVSAEEIVRDRTVLKREGFLNLSWFSYWFSKCLYLAGISAIQMLIYVLVSIMILEIPDMSFKIFGILFSCSICACVLGLNISSAFKTAITIYILIPLLLIPQILLCGVVIKFDDLKSAKAGNNYVPLIGDFMTSRWGLEALIVEQFRSNRYQSSFNEFDREISRSEYIMDSLNPEIQAKLDYLFLKTDLSGKQETMKRYAGIVRNEIRYLEGRTALLSGFSDDLFTVENLTQLRAEEIRDYLKKVTQWFGEKKMDARARKEKLTEQMVKQYNENGLQELRKRNHNANIVNLVHNREELEPIRISGQRLVQLSDPIYQPAVSPWGRAVFLASEKRLNACVMNTYGFNLMVIWLMIIILALLLHFKVFKLIFSR